MTVETDLLTPDDDTVVVTLADLVGPDKKYATVEDLAKAYVNADRHIDALESDLDEARSELTKRVTIEDFMDKMQSAKDKNDERPPVTPASGQNTPPAAALTPEQVKGLLNEELSNLRVQDQRNANAAFVKQELQAAYGKGYVNRLKERASELGVTPEYLADLAKLQPKVVLELIGLPAAQPRGITPPRSSFDALKAPPRRDEKNYKYYQKIRRENPTLYFSPKFRMEMHAEAERQGETFYSD